MIGRGALALAFLVVNPGSVPAQTPAPHSALSIAAKDRSLQPGELVVLTIHTAAPVETLRGQAFGHDLEPYNVDAHTWRALVGIDLDATTGAHRVTVEAGAPPDVQHATYALVVRAKRFPTRRLKVDPSFVNPPENEVPRILAEQKALAALWAESAASRLWTGPFVRPVPDQANSAFGTRSVFNGQPRSPHGGADFLSPAGRPIKAPNAGRVVLARDLYFTGNTVVIDHGLGLFSLMAHMSVMDVHEGDTVTAGQVIGEVGATGRVTGPHLHWAIRAGGARVDPLSVLALLGTPR